MYCEYKLVPSTEQISKILGFCQPDNKDFGYMKTFSDDFYYLAQTDKKVPYPVYDYIFCDEV